jgi:hypothetical protein
LENHSVPLGLETALLEARTHCPRAARQPGDNNEPRRNILEEWSDERSRDTSDTQRYLPLGKQRKAGQRMTRMSILIMTSEQIANNQSDVNRFFNRGFDK